MVDVTMIAQASQAIQVGSNLTGDPPQVVQNRGRHWSFYGMIVAGVVGAVALVAGAILSQIPLAVIGGVLCGTGAVAAYLLKDINALKSLEEYVGHLSTIVTKIEGVVGRLHQGNQELKEINEGLDEAVAEREEILEKSQKKLAMMTTLYENYKKVLVVFTEKLSALNSENDLLDDNVDELLEYVKQMDLNNDKLAGELDEFVEQNNRFDEINGFFKQLIEKFEVNLDALKIEYAEQRKEIEALRETVKTLMSLEKEVAEGTESVLQSQKLYEETDEKLERLVNQLKGLEAVPELLEILKERHVGNKQNRPSGARS